MSSCSHIQQETIDTGPKVTGCVVDLASGGYQCVRIDQDPYFRSFQDSQALQCVSPKDMEATLKACKKNQILQVPQCTISQGVPQCRDPKGAPLLSDLSQLDNYFCLDPKDWTRIYERCDPNE